MIIIILFTLILITAILAFNCEKITYTLLYKINKEQAESDERLTQLMKDLGEL